MPHMLVTGFGAFPGAPRNPTLAILEELRQVHARRLTRLGISLDLRALPVRFAEVGPVLSAALQEAQPDIVLHLGLAGLRRHLSVELRALNRLSLLRPDAGRRVAGLAQIDMQGPSTRPARWDAQRLAAALNQHGPTRLSQDAGDYVCNQTLYLTLGQFDGLAGFIHVPPPRPTLPVSSMAKAISAGIVQLAVQHRVYTAGNKR